VRRCAPEGGEVELIFLYQSSTNLVLSASFALASTGVDIGVNVAHRE